MIACVCCTRWGMDGGVLCFEPSEGLPCSFASTAMPHNILEPHGAVAAGVRLQSPPFRMIWGGRLHKENTCDRLIDIMIVDLCDLVDLGV